MRRQPPNACILLAIGMMLTAIVVVLPMTGRPRSVLVVVGLGQSLFALLHLFQQQ